MLNQECAMLAERWGWLHEHIRQLTTNQRREYLAVVQNLYEQEKEAYSKMRK